MKLAKYLSILTLLVALFSYPTGYFSFSAYQQHLQQQKQELILHKQEKAKAAPKDKQMRCLRQALWFEARSESEHGMRAVATVIINRVKHSRYPKEFCRVIHQRKQFSYTHQLKSFRINPGPTEVTKLQVVDKIIGEVYTGDFVAVLPADVLWYHTVRVKPSWSKQKQQVALIGQHIFRR